MGIQRCLWEHVMELYDRLYSAISTQRCYDEQFTQDVLHLINTAKGMQKGLANLERKNHHLHKISTTNFNALMRWKTRHQRMHDLAMGLLRERYRTENMDVSFARYMTDYLHAHGILGGVNNGAVE